LITYKYQFFYNLDIADKAPPTQVNKTKRYLLDKLSIIRKDVRDYYLTLNNFYVEFWSSIDEQDTYENCWTIAAKKYISAL